MQIINGKTELFTSFEINGQINTGLTQEANVTNI